MKSTKKITDKFWRGRYTSDYTYIGIKEGTIEKWEDGIRIDGAKESYEWWYF